MNVFFFFALLGHKRRTGKGNIGGGAWIINLSVLLLNLVIVSTPQAFQTVDWKGILNIFMSKAGLPGFINKLAKLLSMLFVFLCICSLFQCPASDSKSIHVKQYSSQHKNLFANASPPHRNTIRATQ